MQEAFVIKKDAIRPANAFPSSTSPCPALFIPSLGDLIQFVYGEDGMDGAFIEKQDIAIFAMDDEKFRHNYRVDVTDEKGGFMGVLQLGLDDSSLELLAKLDEEYAQLSDDRNLLRTFIFPRADNTTNFYLPVNMQRIIQNATQIFRIDRRQPSDLRSTFATHVHERFYLAREACCMK
ncbi:DNA-directed RNA polymerase subunit [Mycena indigotica]|uniref:DNA-directed RNA polymerase subunit n=1 Tax=Mycena indigotica TaxID=2126181 RepID=A0A8H6SYX3_9AGAR|nr:DNA-directed RNA polymerase subunit [Mycena indigotica]KAF7307327.1 DNA-directed RNA polymerase subunit [Mycena indigotica]